MLSPSLVLAFAALLTAQAAAATLTWTGATNSNWATASNWDLNQIPASGDSLVLTGSGAAPNNNDLAATVDLASVTLNDGPTPTYYNVSGNAIVLQAGGSLISNDDGTPRINCAVTLNGSTTVAVNGTVWEFAGAIGGVGGIVKTGAGTLTLSGTNTYSGTTAVTAGKLNVLGSTSAASTVSVQTGATIAGTGTVGASLAIADNALLAPGNGGIGTLSIAHMTWHGSSTGAATAIFQLGTAGASDRLAVTDFFNKGTGTTYKFDFGGTGTAGNTYTLATFGSTTFVASDFSFTNLAAGLNGTFAISAGALTFSVAAPPVINSATSASGTYRSPFSYTITATGSPTSFSVTGALPAGVTLNTSTGVISGTPTQTGTFNVTLGASNAGGSDTESLTITIAPATVTPVVTVNSKVFDGTTAATIATRSLVGVLGGDTVTLNGGTATFDTAAVGTGKTVTVTGLTLGGTAAGNYVLSSTTATTNANITVGNVVIDISNLSFVYDGRPHAATITVTPGVPVRVTYNGATEPPVNAGTYLVIVSTLDPNYPGILAKNLTIEKAPAQVTLSGLDQIANGEPRSVSVTTVPANLAVRVTYNGATTAPSSAGTYTVVATVEDPNYVGSATGTLTITANAPTITQQPVSRTVTAGTSVTFSVAATANGSALRYAWRYNGQDIAGATGATLTLDAVRLAQAGAYSVVVTNDSGSVTSASATLTVQPASTAGIYFGTLGGTQGSFALAVRPDGTGTLLLYVNATKAGYAALLTIDADGVFNGVAIPLVRRAVTTAIDGQTVAAAEGDPVVSGRIVNGVVTGSTGSLGLAMAGTLDTTAFPLGGSFTASTLGVAPTVINTIVGANGRAFELVTAGGATSLGTGTVAAGGGFSITTADGSVVAGTIAANGTIAGTVTRSGVSTAFSGVLDGPGAVRRLGNLATRAFGGSGDNVMIAGFVISGNSPKQVLVRGIGPALAQFGVSGVLAQPTLELYEGAAQLAQNTGWSSAANAAEIAAAASANGAFPLANNSADSAILMTLQPGSYTAIVRGPNNSDTGVSLVEVYETGTVGAGRLVNLATRGSVNAATSPLIAGVFVAGNAPKQLLVRAVGPTLANFGVAGAVANPQLQVMQGATVVASNDDWAGDVQVAAAGAAAGAFALPAASRDAALLVTLAPGAYTVVVTGVGTASGVALVEIYEVP